MGSIHQSERGLRVKTPVSSASSSSCHTAWPAPPSPVGDYSQQLEDEYAGSSTAAGPVGEQVMDKTVSTSTGLQCRLHLCTQLLFPNTLTGSVLTGASEDRKHTQECVS